MEDRTTGASRKDAKDNNQVQDMDEESSDEDSDSPDQPAIQPPLPPALDKVVVKKYDPKQGKYSLFGGN